MSATIMLHGTFKAGAHRIRRQNPERDFVSLNISAEGAIVNLVDVSSDDLDSLTEAIAAARKALPS